MSHRRAGQPHTDPPSAFVEVEWRRAVLEDVPAIVDLLAQDPLGAAREDPTEAGAQRYRDAFLAINADPGQLLVVAATDNDIVATMQLSFIPGLARRGALRAQIDAVRVREDQRSHGLGRAMFDWAIEEAQRRGCALVQLTTDKTRADAHRFYDSLGFVASHEGRKLEL